jgi:hypothetical protein
MTNEELKDVAEQKMTNPNVVGRVASALRDGSRVEQRHHDGRKFRVLWEDDGDSWRCTVTDENTAAKLMQIDIHENGTVRADAFAPCRVTVSPEEDLLCVTRYKA